MKKGLNSIPFLEFETLKKKWINIEWNNRARKKIEFTKDQNVITILNKPYYQTFENKFNFLNDFLRGVSKSIFIFHTSQNMC